MINIVINQENFDPTNQTSITINDTSYEILRLADYATAPKKRKAGRSFVCRLQDQAGKKYALKYYQPNVATVLQGHDFKQAFDEQNKVLANIPAFDWTNHRIYISENNPIALQYPNLSHAILMPWISGNMVSAFREQIRTRVIPPLSPATVMRIVKSLLQSLVKLEAIGCAHGDICSDNVIILDDWSVKIIDVDEMYIPNLNPPATLNNFGSGHDGYRFPDRFSSWAAEADRFSTAMLIAEILTLQNVDAANIGAKESLFTTHTPEGINNADEQFINYKDIKAHILNYFDKSYPKCEPLLRNVFTALTLNDCPQLSVWLAALVPQPNQTQTISTPDVRYTKKASSDFPVLIVFVLDISQSMYLTQEHLSGRTRIDEALEIMNNMLIGFRESCVENIYIRPRYHFAYFCYHTSVIDMFNSQQHMSILHIDNFTTERPFDRTSLESANPDGARNNRGAGTNMSSVFSTLREFLNQNIHTYRDSHPPFIIHITDGLNTGDANNLYDQFDLISQIQTKYGSPLVCSLYINGEKDLGLITDNIEIAGTNEYIDAVRTLLRISSTIPSPYRLRHANLTIPDTTKFVFSYKSDPHIITDLTVLATGTGTGTGT